MRPLQLPGQERFSRLPNVTATLLHISFMNMSVEEEELRGASFELLVSVLNSFNLDHTPVLSLKGQLCIHFTLHIIFIAICVGIWGMGTFINLMTQINELISTMLPHLTLDFISEVANTIEKGWVTQRLHSLEYMSPWLKNLNNYVDPTHSAYDHSSARVRDCIRVLIDITLGDLQVRILHYHRISSADEHAQDPLCLLQAHLGRDRKTRLAVDFFGLGRVDAGCHRRRPWYPAM